MADHRKLRELVLIVLSLSVASVATSDDPASSDPSYYYSLCSSSRCGGERLPYPFGVPRFCHNPLMSVACSPDSLVLFSSGQQTGNFRVVGNLTVGIGGTTVTVASDSLFTCGRRVSDPNYSYGVSVFSLPNNYTFGTHLNCTRLPAGAGTLQPAACLGCSNEGRVCFYSPGFVTFPECEKFYLFVPLGFNVSAEVDLRGYLQRGFPIRYSKPADCRTCEGSGGLCGASPAGGFVCFCPASVHNVSCKLAPSIDISSWAPPASKSSSTTLIIVLSTCLPAVALLLAGVVVAVVLSKNRRWRRRDDGDGEGKAEEEVVAAMTRAEMKEVVEGISPARYTYSQIKKMTGGFKTKIGEGGSGDIYKGSVKTKTKVAAAAVVPVAVKVLKETKQSEKQFMNEVATVGRIHHHNLVALLGYCVEGRKRALVYEYLENGSLDNFIGRRRPMNLSGDLLRAIALDTARGILYLHEGCRSRILHCDIKPHNVLVGADFSAKVTDFGLARIADKGRSHVSITAARGTPGYAAPEMWAQSYGPITEKSDVYSYGMLLLEMAGVRDSNDGDGGGRAFGKVYEVMASRRGGGSEDEEGVMDRLYLVGLWCIQHIPANRPTMAGVMQMLAGDDEIPTPPYPFPVEDPTVPESACTS